MPAAIGAAIAAAVGLTGAFAGPLIGLAVSFALSAVSGVLFGQANRRAPQFADRLDRGRTQMIRSSVEPHRIVYGEARVSGPLVLAGTRGDERQWLFLVIPVAGHEVHAFTGFWVNDIFRSTDDLSGDGKPTSGRFKDNLVFRSHVGKQSQGADNLLLISDLNESEEWTANHRLRGVAYMVVRLQWDRDVFPTGIPNMSARVQGRKLWDPRDTPATITSSSPGSPGTITTSAAHGASVGDTVFIVDHAGSNPVITKRYEVNTAPTATTLTLLGQDGEPLAITTGGTGGSLYVTSYSNNWALCVLDYLLNPSGINVAEDEIHLASFTEAANVSDENVAIDGSTTQKRYTCDGVVFTDENPIDVTEDLLTAGAGMLIYTEGKYRLYAGAYRTPSVTITENDLRGALRVRPRVARQQLFNRMRGTYINPDDDWQEADFPPVENSLYVSQDNGEEISRDIKLPFTIDPIRAQRIGKIHLEKSRQGITVEWPGQWTCLRLAVGQTVMVSVDQLGWASKVFLVTGWKVAPDMSGVDIVLQEEAATAYDWNFGEATTIDAAPDTSLPSPTDVILPTGVTAQSGTDQLLARLDGTVVSRILVTWTAPADIFVTRGGEIDVEFKRSVDSAWNVVTVRGSETQAFISPVEDGVDYDIRLRSRNSLGVRAASTTAAIVHTVIGKTAAPGRPDTFNVTRLADGTRRFSWSQASVPADVRSGGGYRIRYFLGATSDWDAMTALHTGVLIASPYETNELAAGTYTFAIATVDASGNESAEKRFISATIGDPRLRSVLAQRLEHDLDFPGTRTSCFLDSDMVLRSVSSQTWADMPSAWSSLPSTWNAIVSQTSPIVYETPEIDLGSDVSWAPLVTVTGDGNATITMKTGTQADGGVIGSYVSLAPASGKRYAQFRVSMADGTAPSIETLTILFDGETKVKDIEDLNTGTSMASWFSSVAAGHFRVKSPDDDLDSITSATIRAIQNVGAGYSWELISKSATVGSPPDGPFAEFKVYNASSTLTDATVDIELKGPKKVT